ncbi:MAG: RnfABCDGE type electron transport complex subunit G [Bacteroidota bacterium]
MAQKESTFLNMTVTLFLITAVAAASLGFVNEFTKKPIAQVKEDKLKESINLVVPGAGNGKIKNFSIAQAEGGDSLYFYEVYVNEKLIGTAIKTYTNIGFSGHFTVMVGFDAEGNIIDNNVLEHKETPGLGDKTSKAKSIWNEQFNGKNPAQYKLVVKKDGGDVDAITAATISSRAYCDALRRAYTAFADYYKLNSVSVENADQKNGGTE